MATKSMIAAVCAVMIVPAVAFAQSVTVTMPDGQVTASADTANQSATVVKPAVITEEYLERLAKIDAQIQILNKQNELKQATQRLVGQEEQAQLPSIVNIVFNGQGASAKLLFANGMIREVKAGDELGNNVTVKEITSHSVKVATRKSTSDLAFHNAMSVTGAAPGAAMPPLPAIR